jgi:hypothetical protein
VALYAEMGSLNAVGRELGLYAEQIKRILKSPEGNFALQQQLKENAKARLVRMGALIDRTLDKLEHTLDHGNDTLTRTGEVIQLGIQARDLTYILAWLHNSQDRWSELMSQHHDAIDVTAISHEEKQRNIERLETLLAQERKALATSQPPPDPAPPQDPESDAPQQEDDRSDWLA